jgi:hypothetical protein
MIDSIRLVARWLRDQSRLKAARLLSRLPHQCAPLRGYVASSSLRPSDGLLGYVVVLSEGIPEPSDYVVRLRNGRVLFDYGVVSTDQGMLLSDLTAGFGGKVNDHSALRRLSLPIRKRFKGKLAVLTSGSHQRYYHWLFDIVPRFDILMRSGVGYDGILINNELPFQRQTISTLGINPSLVISPNCESHFIADELVIPSLPGSGMKPSATTIQLLRKTFLSSSKRQENGRRIYITRADADTRRVCNELELQACLISLGFEVHQLSTLDMTKQVELFASASVIISPHGAGLANIIFCNPECLLMELMPESYVVDCFKVIAEKVGLVYQRVMCKPVNPGDGLHDMIVELNQLYTILGDLLN